MGGEQRGGSDKLGYENKRRESEARREKGRERKVKGSGNVECSNILSTPSTFTAVWTRCKSIPQKINALLSLQRYFISGSHV